MPIPPEHMKERLSIAYVSAVAARAGVACRPTTAPEYGTDVHIVKVKKLDNGKYVDTGYILNCQVKATSNFEIQGDNIAYDMDAEDFNKLATWEGGSCVLILFCLPKTSEEWLSVNEEELILKRCCYWAQISDPPTTNKSSRRITISRSQLFTPESVNYLLEKIRLGEL
jgi:hypothetical protein